MKIVIPGGAGQVGGILTRALESKGHEVVVLSRNETQHGRCVKWDGRTPDAWTAEIDGADAVINLAGRSVNCRYTESNLKQMMDSRIESTRAVGAAIEGTKKPPRVWMQMSTATIYAHSFDAPNDESGPLCGDESGTPAHWRRSIDIAKAWEHTLQIAATPRTRKVALRTAMVMSPDQGGVFDLLSGLTRLGLGGALAGGAQYMSWIHEQDFVRVIEFLLNRDDFDGAVNLAAPNPLPQRDFMIALRNAWGTRIGLPATKWMLEIGTFFMRTESELMLKSRRVIPGRLLSAGFSFEFADWPGASKELVSRCSNSAVKSSR